MEAYIFPGQGSQSKGMGSTLFTDFKELTEQADNILGYSIKDLCIEDKDGRLSKTQFTQPALFIVNAFSYLKKLQETGIKPDFVAGHSLGEYNALFAAGAFDFVTGLKLVKKRGELMSRATGGGMAAIIGLSEENIKEVLEKNSLMTIDIANFNSPKQIVIAGMKDDIEHAKEIFEAAGALQYIVLNVSGAFHSRYMLASSKNFEEYLNTFAFNDLEIPVISNSYARPYKNEGVKETLVEQMKSSVKWCESIRYLMGRGCEKFEQIGPGNVLTGLVRNIKREAQPLIIEEHKEVSLHNDNVIAAKLNNSNVTYHEEEQIMEKNINEDKINKTLCFMPESLGSKEFKEDYGLKYAYIAGAMYRGIASERLVVKMGRAGFIAFFGAGGLDLNRVEEAIKSISSQLSEGQPFGINLINNLGNPEKEEKTVDLLQKYKIKNVEAAAYIGMTPALVRLRLKGLRRNEQGNVISNIRIIAKLSRPEVAEAFLSPAPDRIVNKLLQEQKISPEEAELSKEIAMADDICVEADSGGHTDQGVAYVLMPAMLKLRNEMMEKYKYKKRIRVGAAGGIGTPEAAAAAFILGAEFITTGSINQCTVEADTSESVKNLLESMNVQDTDYAPAGDMFEIGAKVQVLKKGLFFPARANKLYELYRQYNSIDEIDEKTKKQVQEKYFKKSFDDVYSEIKAYISRDEAEKAERNPKHKMALIFRWYFRYSTQLAIEGMEENKVDYQVHCGASLGAFNQWVKGTPLEKWSNRHVDLIAEKLLVETSELLNRRINEML